MEREKLIELVQAAQAGSDDALQALYIDAAKSAYYLANKNLCDTHAAEDMVQEVFITVSEKIGTLKEPAAFYRWLNLITVRKCADVFRKHHEFLSDTEHDDELFDIEDIDTGVQPDAILDSVETRRMIVEVIDNLPPAQRICIYYYYYGRLTVQQISELLDVTPSAVKKRLAVGREKIKEAILQKEKDEGIKLYAAPLALTPILRMALDEYTMPEGVLDSIWHNIAQAIGIGDAGTGGDSPANNSAQRDTQGQGPNEPAQPDQPKGEPNMNNQPGNNPQQPSQYPQQGQQPQYPQGQQPYQQQGQPYQPQQGYPSQQPGQFPQGGQPYSAQPQGQPFNATHPTPPPAAPAMAAQAANAAGAGAAKAGMALGAKIAIAAVSIIAVAGLAVGAAILVPQWLGDADSADAVSSLQSGDMSMAGASDTPTVTFVTQPPVQDGFADAHEVVLSVDGEDIAGIYEGDYTDGLFSGYGVWEYGRYRYEGYWENGVPNGEGILTRFMNDNRTETEQYYEGHFVDGCPNGSFTQTTTVDGINAIYVYEFDMGTSISRHRLQSSNKPDYYMMDEIYIKITPAFIYESIEVE